AGFQKWLRERAENAAEFEGLNEVWDLVSDKSIRGTVPRLERWERTQESRDLEVLRKLLSERERGMRHAGSFPSGRFRRWAFAAYAVAGLGILGYLALRAQDPSDYATKLGEQRTVQLEDGTSISLNTSTRIRVRYSDRERRVELDKGEALFNVSK